MALLPYQVTLVAKQDAPYNVLPDTDLSIRKVSDDTLIQIYADEAGIIPIPQPGAKTDSRGVFSFFADGSSDLLKAVWSDGVSSYSEAFYIGDHAKLTNLNSGHVNLYKTTFKGGAGASAVDSMIAGVIDGDVIVTHSVGNQYSTGGTEWEYIGGSSGIDNFKLTSNAFLDDFYNLDWLDAANKAIYSSIKDGFQDIEIGDSDYSLQSRPLGASEVTFIGSGSFSGAGAYRIRLITENSDNVESHMTLSPHHLKRFGEIDNPVVVICGDSLSTLQPDSLDQTGTLANLIKTKLQSDNPNKSISIHNRAIGGQTFSTFNGIPSAFPVWYTDQLKPWIDYIEDLQPDLVTIGFGMNDGQNDGFSMADAISAINKVKGFSKPCDIVFVTTPVPTLNATGIYSDYSTEASQEGRDRCAGFIRTYSKYYGHGYIDANRMSNASRDGFDVERTTTKRDLINISSGGAIMPSKGTDFSYQLSCSETAFSTPGNTFAIKVGPDRLDVVLVVDSGGFLRFDFYASSLYKSVVSKIPTPAGTWNLLAEKRGNRFYASNSGTTPTDDVLSEIIISGGGVFNPSCGWFESDYTSGPVNWPFFANIGIYGQCTPSAKDSDLWGAHVDGDAGLKLPYGGNGLNHPSSIGVDRFYHDALSGCDTSSDFNIADNYSSAGTVSIPTGAATSIPVFSGQNSYTFKKSATYSISFESQATTAITSGELSLRLGASPSGTVLKWGDVIDAKGQLSASLTRAFTAGDSITFWFSHSTGADITLVNIFSSIIEL